MTPMCSLPTSALFALARIAIEASEATADDVLALVLQARSNAPPALTIKESEPSVDDTSDKLAKPE